MLFEWIHRNENDPKTYGELFFDMCEDVRDKELSTALKELMQLFISIFKNFVTIKKEELYCQLQQWISSQSRYIQDLLEKLC